MKHFSLLLAGCLCLTACDASEDVTVGSSLASSATGSPAEYAATYADAVPTFDAQLNAVSIEHPGFKGIIGSDDGSSVIVLVDAVVVQRSGTPGSASLETALSERLGIEPTQFRVEAVPMVQARSGRAATTTERPDFHILYDVKTGLRRFLFETDLVTRLDIDETTGRVVVGTASVAKAEQVRATMNESEFAVTDFVVVEPFRSATASTVLTASVSRGASSSTNRSLRNDAFRPLIAGAKTEYRTQDGLQGSACTQGPAVSYAPGNLYGFLTNSHCTIDRNNVTNVRYFQPQALQGDFIGHEIAEPGYRNVWGGFMHTSGFYADVAFVQTQQNIGLRGQTTSAGYCGASADCLENGIITDITGTSSYLAVNTSVFKTGQTTGTTAGQIVRTCVDEVDGDNVRHLCQSFVGFGSVPPAGPHIVDGGDSGAAVLIRSNVPGTNQGLVAGIVWGRNPTRTEFAFSPWENIWQSERAGTQYGLPVQAVTSTQGVVSNSAYLNPGPPPPTGGGTPGGGNPGGGNPGGGNPGGGGDPPDCPAEMGWSSTRATPTPATC